MDAIDAVERTIEVFTKFYQTELVTKRVKMSEVLLAFWCFAEYANDELKEILDKYGIEFKEVE